MAKMINVQTLGEMCSAALDGEPVFILRAQDAASVETIRDYLIRTDKQRGTNGYRVKKALEQFAKWQTDHHTRPAD